MKALQRKRPHVVIVGAGFGGLQAARALGKAPVDVTVIDRNNHHLFQPLLYQVATAVLSPADISAPIRAVVRRQRNTEVLMAEVTGVDLERQEVITHERRISYDYLIIATGAAHSYFGHDEWGAYSSGLKTIVNATSIRRKLLLAFEASELEPDPEKRRALLTFVLVGGGPTGVEMAGAIAELAHKVLAGDFRHFDPRESRILLLEALPRILPAFPEHLAQRAQEALTHLGVEVRTSSPVEKIDEEGVIAGGGRIPSHNVIWTAGVSASPAGKWLNAEVDRAGRVKVLANLTLPDYPNVFVIGDTACALQKGKPLPGVAPVAMQQGRYVADVIRRRVTGQRFPGPFRYRNKGSLATVGRSFGIADLGKLQFAGFSGWLLWLIVHIIYLIGFRNRVLVLFQWAWAFLTFERGARLITFESTAKSPVDEPIEELL